MLLPGRAESVMVHGAGYLLLAAAVDVLAFSSRQSIFEQSRLWGKALSRSDF